MDRRGRVDDWRSIVASTTVARPWITPPAAMYRLRATDPWRAGEHGGCLSHYRWPVPLTSQPRHRRSDTVALWAAIEAASDPRAGYGEGLVGFSARRAVARVRARMPDPGTYQKTMRVSWAR